ncbi:heavy metal-associated isoprenylated plant protein [Salix suchowensis]|nr:heavy metal-associated isoprenylated plant protein [Salix suchowensis]
MHKCQPNLKLAIFTVKVDLICCSKCTLRATEKLQKIKGVDSITIDAAKDLVTVSGSVEPRVILEKFAKWGKTAELFSFQKEPVEIGDGDDSDKTNLNKNSYRKSDSSVPGAEPASRFLHDNPNMHVARHSKKDRWCWLGKKIFGNKPRPRSSAAKAHADNKWQAPRIPVDKFGSSKPIYGNQLAMHEFGPSHYPFYGSQLPADQFGSSRAFNGSHFNRPSMYGRPGQPVTPQPMYMPGQPFLLPYAGGMQPWAAAAPSHSFNPMIHYTGYDDNYRHW